MSAAENWLYSFKWGYFCNKHMDFCKSYSNECDGGKLFCNISAVYEYTLKGLSDIKNTCSGTVLENSWVNIEASPMQDHYLLVKAENCYNEHPSPWRAWRSFIYWFQCEQCHVAERYLCSTCYRVPSQISVDLWGSQQCDTLIRGPFKQRGLCKADNYFKGATTQSILCAYYTCIGLVSALNTRVIPNRHVFNAETRLIHAHNTLRGRSLRNKSWAHPGCCGQQHEFL